jgi:hypothetical protein
MLANILQVFGAVSVTVGAGLVWVPAGFIVGGLLSILLGLGAARKGA